MSWRAQADRFQKYWRQHLRGRIRDYIAQSQKCAGYRRGERTGRRDLANPPIVARLDQDRRLGGPVHAPCRRRWHIGAQVPGARDLLTWGSAPHPGSVARGDPCAPRRSLAGAPCAPSPLCGSKREFRTRLRLRRQHPPKTEDVPEPHNGLKAGNAKIAEKAKVG